MATSIVEIERPSEKEENKSVGKVVVPIEVTNVSDKALADAGVIKPSEVRSIHLDKVLADSGATRLALPTDVILSLGLVSRGTRNVITPTGTHKARVFTGV